ncbi:class I SAM-dependent methyltransferase [Clostridium sp. HBUAS56010]|uniref:class I SAM-dependent methyltransferase n=1 Tax=Clostridium sp. HBUAS56010 TaxID=2571127 RepID=UPI0011777008|nr:class I SAM-dependent methyltransferase [Clostridium sp. HBUAS56010]
MRNIDLDNVLQSKRKKIRDLADLDIDNKDNEISIEEILTQINRMAEDLVDNKDYIKPKTYIKLSSISKSNILIYLRKIDNRLKKIGFYEKWIRLILKRIIGTVYNSNIIDSKELLKFEGEEFIEVLYRSLLLREVDPEAKRNALTYIFQSNDAKVYLIDSIANSSEMKLLNIHVKGIKRKKNYLTIKKFIYKIPIIGYVVQILVSIVLLPKVYREYQILKKVEQELGVIKLRENDIGRKVNEVEKFINDQDSLKKQLEKKRLLEKNAMNLLYLHYNEKLMPDSREEVKSRARIYIDKINQWFENKSKKELKVVDLGCGECEWIELLNESGYMAQGVDSNAFVIRKVKELFPDIRIEENDALSYLKKQPENSIDLLTSFHMVEHLHMEFLVELIIECKRVLKKGGMFIVETPNPQNILISSYYFHLDPTHNKPIPPELLAFFINECGLEVVEKVLLYPLDFIPYEYKDNDPIKDIIYRFNMEQAYSILAVKK